MNKRASGFDIGLTLPQYIAFFVLVAFGVAAFGGSYASLSNAGGDISTLRETIIAEALINNPECFAYEDPSGRIMRSVDSEKFTEEKLQECMKLSEHIIQPNEIQVIGEQARYLRSGGYATLEEEHTITTIKLYEEGVGSAALLEVNIP